MDLVECVYRITSSLPSTETYALMDQMKRSSVSVPSNIAEGQKRLNNKETIHFSGIAPGSLAELETQLILCERLYRIKVEDALSLCVEVGKMLTTLLKSLRSKI